MKNQGNQEAEEGSGGAFRPQSLMEFPFKKTEQDKVNRLALSTLNN